MTSPKHLCDREARARAILREQRLAPTRPRIAIVGALLESEGWFDAEDLLARVKARCPRVSRATVYRLIPLLSRAGLLHATDFGDGRHRYRRADPGAVPMAEIFVVDCGKIIERPAPFLSWYGKSIADKAGLELESQRLQTFARCAHKRAGGTCEDCPHEDGEA